MKLGAVLMSANDNSHPRTAKRMIRVRPPRPRERTNRAFFLAPPSEDFIVDEEDRTEEARFAFDEEEARDATEFAVFTADMVDQLRQRLREAEAREDEAGSGVRLVPSHECYRHAIVPPPPELDDPFADLEIDVEDFGG